MSASVMLSCLFLPKLYIIYIHPEKNVRRLTMNNPKAKARLKELGLKTADSNDKNRNKDNGPRGIGSDEGNSALGGASLLAAQSSNSHTRASATLTMTSSTRMDEVGESGTALDSVVNADVDLTKPRRSFAQADDQKPKNSFVNVISNPLVVNEAPRKVDIKPTTVVPKSRPSINLGSVPAGTPAAIYQAKQPNNSDFPTPTPLLLDTIPKRLMLSPTYCDETTSMEEDDGPVDEDNSTIAGVPMSYQCEASSCSQIVLPHLYHNVPYSPTDSLCSGETAHSSDLYIQSYGDDTQIVPSMTSNSLSVASGSVFSQMRQPPKTISRIDYSKQTVTAL
ncbi:unnamed protein product [Echinostoma caproni]|uniref:G-protein coupled receptors family 3 profile domain-containing protein n=1 Tax=Echinostoma caproni TaxID=27848 RepID=A0A3P8HWB5_9TREM|nr:unnamed protein product [Echinostoma caproni]